MYLLLLSRYVEADLAVYPLWICPFRLPPRGNTVLFPKGQKPHVFIFSVLPVLDILHTETWHRHIITPSQ